MKVFHKGEEIENAAQVKVLAEQYDLVDGDVRLIIQLMKDGEAVLVSDYPDIIKPSIISLLSNLEAGEPANLKPRKRKGGHVKEVEAVIVPQIDNDTVTEVIRRQVDMLSEVFDMDSNGLWRINPDNPPEVQDALKCVEAINLCRNSADAVAQKSDWFLANIIDACEEYFGEEFEISQVVAMTNRSHVYLGQIRRAYKWVKEHGRVNLPITHHNEVVLRSGISDDDKMKILKMAEEHGMSAAKTRKTVLQVQRIGVEATEEQLLNEIREGVKPPEKKRMWLVRVGSRWFEAATPFGEKEIPVGDEVIRLPQGQIFQKREGRMRPVLAGQYYRFHGKKYEIPAKS
jgi:hypothetical protein